MAVVVGRLLPEEVVLVDHEGTGRLLPEFGRHLAGRAGRRGVLAGGGFAQHPVHVVLAE